MATKKTSASNKARVLVDCAYGNVNDVVELTAEQLQEAIASGQVDNDPDAVAYALSLKE